jgi:hypothetical protein
MNKFSNVIKVLRTMEKRNMKIILYPKINKLILYFLCLGTMIPKLHFIPKAEAVQ